ncbi:MAG: hypothetical protein HY701_10050 [Gemmatimonadetes bacterium]|nr:hypothetical protein [Gemmatimonadota bacterium]
MTDQVTDDIRPRLKDSTGWFAAGAAFRRALLTLSDGAFKLFAYICLEADRRTGRFETTQRELARALGKSRRIIGSYIAEVDSNGICRVRPGANQFARTMFEIADEYWPYERHISDSAPSKETTTYIQAVRETFLSIACTSGRFTASDARTASQMQADGIPLAIVQDAILLGACRKYVAWLNAGAAEPIGSLRYVEPIVAELRRQPLPPGYRGHLQRHSARYGARWEAARARDSACSGGYPDMASTEIVQ